MILPKHYRVVNYYVKISISRLIRRLDHDILTVSITKKTEGTNDMAKKTTTKKTTKKVASSVSGSGTATLLSATAILFAGTSVVLIGMIQDADHITLLMVGFGAALLVIGGALLGTAARTSKK
jgi:hypothetical protein